MSKHTAGPWMPYLYKTGIGVRAAKIVFPARATTVSICRMSIADNSIHRETGWTNARLISAAPDLLEALIKLSNEVMGSLPLFEPLARREMGNTNYAILIQRAEEARALITKITGGS